MKEVIIFSKSRCSYCEAAKNILNDHNIPFIEIVADASDENKRKFRSMVPESFKTVPQIFVGNKHIGGYTALRQRIFEVVGDMNIERKIV